MSEQANSKDTYTTLDGSDIQTVLESLLTEAKNATMSPTFICEFTTAVEPQEVLETVFEGETEYDSLAFPLKVSSEDEYYQVNGVIGIESEDGAKLDAEICPEWMRVYVRSSTDVKTLTQFFMQFNEEYPFKIVVAEEYL